MKIPIYSPVTLLTSKYLENGVKTGDYGVVVEVYEDGYEVEFLDEKGNTLNCFGVEKNEVQAVENKQNQQTLTVLRWNKPSGRA